MRFGDGYPIQDTENGFVGYSASSVCTLVVDEMKNMHRSRTTVLLIAVGLLVSSPGCLGSKTAVPTACRPTFSALHVDPYGAAWVGGGGSNLDGGLLHIVE
jgi:hypothetical protein